MANVVTKQNKADVVGNIRARLSESELVIFADYRGLTVQEFASLRGKLKAERLGDIKVCKNTLTRIAVSELSFSCPESYFQGPLALVTATEDSAAVAKIVVDFAKENEAFSIKGGVLNQSPLDSELLRSLAKLPNRETMVAMVVGAIKMPLTGLVGGLSSPILGLIHTLRAIGEKKSGGENK